MPLFERCLRLLGRLFDFLFFVSLVSTKTCSLDGFRDLFLLTPSVVTRMCLLPGGGVRFPFFFLAFLASGLSFRLLCAVPDFFFFVPTFATDLRWISPCLFSFSCGLPGFFCFGTSMVIDKRLPFEYWFGLLSGLPDSFFFGTYVVAKKRWLSGCILRLFHGSADSFLFIEFVVLGNRLHFPCCFRFFRCLADSSLFVNLFVTPILPFFLRCCVLSWRHSCLVSFGPSRVENSFCTLIRTNCAEPQLVTMVSTPFLTWTRSLCKASISFAHTCAMMNFSAWPIRLVRCVRRFKFLSFLRTASNSSRRILSAVEISVVSFGTWAAPPSLFSNRWIFLTSWVQLQAASEIALIERNRLLIFPSIQAIVFVTVIIDMIAGGKAMVRFERDGRRWR